MRAINPKKDMVFPPTLVPMPWSKVAVKNILTLFMIIITLNSVKLKLLLFIGIHQKHPKSRSSQSAGKTFSFQP